MTRPPKEPPVPRVPSLPQDSTAPRTPPQTPLPPPLPWAPRGANEPLLHVLSPTEHRSTVSPQLLYSPRLRTAATRSTNEHGLPTAAQLPSAAISTFLSTKAVPGTGSCWLHSSTEQLPSTPLPPPQGQKASLSLGCKHAALCQQHNRASCREGRRTQPGSWACGWDGTEA